MPAAPGSQAPPVARSGRSRSPAASPPTQGSRPTSIPASLLPGPSRLRSRMPIPILSRQLSGARFPGRLTLRLAATFNSRRPPAIAHLAFQLRRARRDRGNLLYQRRIAGTVQLWPLFEVPGVVHDHQQRSHCVTVTMIGSNASFSHSTTFTLTVK